MKAAREIWRTSRVTEVPNKPKEAHLIKMRDTLKDIELFCNEFGYDFFACIFDIKTDEGETFCNLETTAEIVFDALQNKLDLHRP